MYTGGGWSVVWSHKVAGKCFISTENGQMASIGDIFSSVYHINTHPPSLASHVVMH